LDRQLIPVLFTDIRERLGWRVWLLAGLQAVTGLMEGLAVASILPLLGLVGIGQFDSSGTLARALTTAVDAVGLSFSPTTMLVIIVAILVVNYAVFLTQAALAARLYAEYGTGWQNDIFRNVIEARWRYFVRRRGGDLMNALTGEVTRVSGAFHQFTLLAAASITAAIYLGFALMLSWSVTLLVLALGGLLFAVTRPLVRRAYRVGNDVSHDNAELQALGGQFFAGAKLIKATATERNAIAQVGAILARLRRSTFFSLFDGQLIRSIFEFGGAVALIALLVVGVRLLDVDAGVVVIVLVLFVRLFPKLSSLQQSIQSINVLAPSVATLRTIRAEATAERDASSAALPSATGGSEPAGIVLKNVSVSYDDEAVLRGIDLEIRKGETLAIVGGSGAGKSTLVDCLLRLVDPAAGLITIDGRSLAELPLSEWRRSVGYLSQEAVLFNASVAANIAWGLPHLSPGQVEAAATQVGDRGVRLSGGERQRIALARALAGEPRLLILDEATSALDAETERSVTDALIPLKGTVTIVLVAHRLSTCRIADRIVVLEGGRIVEGGTLTDLMARPGRFRELWSLQTGLPGAD
jgi:ATP-binding cassette subfamily C protein